MSSVSTTIHIHMDEHTEIQHLTNIGDGHVFDIVEASRFTNDKNHANSYAIIRYSIRIDAKNAASMREFAEAILQAAHTHEPMREIAD